MLTVRTLEELDGSEAKLVLMDLPPMDVDRVSHSVSKVEYPARPFHGIEATLFPTSSSRHASNHFGPPAD
jgi:hypothetical protein